MMSKSEDEAYKLLENMALNNFQWPSERVTPKKPVGMYDIDVFFNLAAQVSLLTKKIQATQLQNAQASTNAIEAYLASFEFCNG